MENIIEATVKNAYIGLAEKAWDCKVQFVADGTNSAIYFTPIDKNDGGIFGLRLSNISILGEVKEYSWEFWNNQLTATDSAAVASASIDELAQFVESCLETTEGIIESFKTSAEKFGIEED